MRPLFPAFCLAVFLTASMRGAETGDSCCKAPPASRQALLTAAKPPGPAAPASVAPTPVPAVSSPAPTLSQRLLAFLGLAAK